jgi:prolyl 4-hydroxylase
VCARVPTQSSLAVSRRETPTLADQIMVFPGALSDPHCQQLIDRFEACDGLEPCRREGGHSFTQLNITRAWPDEHERMLAVFIAHFNQYQDAMGAEFWPAAFAFEHLRIKRYLPGGRDAFPPHVDVVDQISARRFMTAMIYLNAPAGGETTFPSLDIAIAPETGKLLAFPPLWLFPHAGLPPRLSPKYILHTYLCYGT